MLHLEPFRKASAADSHIGKSIPVLGVEIRLELEYEAREVIRVRVDRLGIL